MALDISEIVASTMEKYHSTFVDNIYKKHVLLDHLKSGTGGSGVKLYDGGDKIRVPLMHASHTAVQTLSGAQTIDMTYQETLTAAEYVPKMYNASIVITKEDQLRNAGDQQVVSLLRAKIEQAELGLAERINTDLYSGTAADNEIVGLDTIMSTTTTIGGISGSTNAFWRANVDSTAAVFSFADLRNIKNSCNNGNGGSRVSAIVTTQAIYEKMFALMTTTYQTNPVLTKESKRIADAGFDVIQFEGAPVSYDEAATAGSVYLVNKDNYNLGVYRDANFAREKKSSPADQHLYVEHVVFYGQSIVNRRKSLGALKNKTV